MPEVVVLAVLLASGMSIDSGSVAANTLWLLLLGGYRYSFGMESSGNVQRSAISDADTHKAGVIGLNKSKRKK